MFVFIYFLLLTLVIKSINSFVLYFCKKEVLFSFIINLFINSLDDLFESLFIKALQELILKLENVEVIRIQMFFFQKS